MDGWNTTFLLGRLIFRVYVNFREGIRNWSTLAEIWFFISNFQGSKMEHQRLGFVSMCRWMCGLEPVVVIVIFGAEVGSLYKWPKFNGVSLGWNPPLHMVVMCEYYRFMESYKGKCTNCEWHKHHCKRCKGLDWCRNLIDASTYQHAAFVTIRMT